MLFSWVNLEPFQQGLGLSVELNCLFLVLFFFGGGGVFFTTNDLAKFQKWMIKMLYEIPSAPQSHKIQLSSSFVTLSIPRKPHTGINAGSVGEIVNQLTVWLMTTQYVVVCYKTSNSTRLHGTFLIYFFLQLSIVSGSMTDKLAIVRRKFLLPFLFDDFKWKWTYPSMKYNYIIKSIKGGKSQISSIIC